MYSAKYIPAKIPHPSVMIHHNKRLRQVPYEETDNTGRYYWA